MQKSVKFIVLLGIVSLFSDVTYEGARSIFGPYLSELGASGSAVGAIVGIGSLLGYGIRSFSGYLSDQTKYTWPLTILGYLINLLAIPLLAFATSWPIAACLIVLERFGKGIRVPPRDAMLSFATKHTGRGWGFGLHEALDQIGAVIGPLLIAILLYFKQSYRLSFGTLLIPAVLALFSLFIARKSFPSPEKMEKQQISSSDQKHFPLPFFLFLIAVSLVALGFADFALIAYHFQKQHIVSPEKIPLFYAFAMAVDGFFAFFAGKWFDRKGFSFLTWITLLSSFFAPLVFFGNVWEAFLGISLWGIGMGSQESLMRASVAVLIPPSKRGSAYGLLSTVFGFALAIGSFCIGFLYDLSFLYVVLFSLVLQFASIPFFLFLKKYHPVR